MEFKKQNRHNPGRTTQSDPQFSGSLPARQSAPVGNNPTPSRHQPFPPTKPLADTPKRITLARVRRLISSKKPIPTSVAIVAIAVVGAAAVGLLVHHITKTVVSTGSTMSTAETPSYHTVLPGGKSISDLGGWKRVSPPKNDPVFAYVDTLNGVLINVSQQPLPVSFTTDVDNHIAELAKGYNATDKVDAGDTNLYVGTSAKGPQSVILTKKNLLILIKSQNKIDDTSWAKYTQSLN